MSPLSVNANQLARNQLAEQQLAEQREQNEVLSSPEILRYSEDVRGEAEEVQPIRRDKEVGPTELGRGLIAAV